MRLRVRAAAGLIALLFAAVIRSETVDVKYRGNVNLKTFQRRDTLRSSFIQRVSVGLNYFMVKRSGNLAALIVPLSCRSHNRPRTAALRPRFCQTMMTSSINK
jgi:hypothetical protein